MVGGLEPFGDDNDPDEPARGSGPNLRSGCFAGQRQCLSNLRALLFGQQDSQRAVCGRSHPEEKQSQRRHRPPLHTREL